MAALENLHSCQFDVKTAFLYRELTEEIYMAQPVGYEDGTSKGNGLSSSQEPVWTEASF